jgi:hypothetical protein
VASTVDGATLTRAHRAAQARIYLATAQAVVAAWPGLDPRNLAPTVDRWLPVVLALVEQGRYQSAQLAANYLREYALAETGVALTAPLAPATAATERAVTTSLRVTGPITIATLTAAGASPEDASRQALSKVLGAASRHVLAGGRQTIGDAVDASLRQGERGRIVGFARVTDGDPCAFCRMLASRGPVYSTYVSAGGRTDWHDKCSCGVEPVMRGTRGAYEWPGRGRDYASEWAEATAGLSGQDAINAYRRYVDSGAGSQ